MKSDPVKLVESIVNRMLTEEALDGQDAKLVADMVKAISTIPYAKMRTNDKFIHDKWNVIDQARIDLMNYLEQNSQYKFVGTKNSWKLVKK